MMARVALWATLMLPAFIMHGRAVAELLIGAIDLCFLLGCARMRAWEWLRTPWVPLAGAWWVWLMLCSLPVVSGGTAGNLAQAVAIARFLILVAALEHAVLRPAVARVWMWRAVVLTTLYITLQTLLQFATGHDLQGFARGPDGELTGPFEHPRAAAPLSRLLFPAILPAARAALVLGLMLTAVLTLVLIGQRMPLLLTLLGLLVTCLLLPRLRWAMVAAMLAGCVLLAASAAVSPPAFHRLVTKFTTQMEDFGDTDYGRIAVRAAAIVRAHPMLGQGFDAYRRVCQDPAYGPAPPGACNIHPHNHYLEAASASGLPGLILFSAMIAAWLLALGRALWRGPTPLRAGLFVAALIQEWPIASTSSFTAMDIGGFFFLLLGWGLAESHAAIPGR